MEDYCFHGRFNLNHLLFEVSKQNIYFSPKNISSKIKSSIVTESIFMRLSNLKNLITLDLQFEYFSDFFAIQITNTLYYLK